MVRDDGRGCRDRDYLGNLFTMVTDEELAIRMSILRVLEILEAVTEEVNKLRARVTELELKGKS